MARGAIIDSNETFDKKAREVLATCAGYVNDNRSSAEPAVIDTFSMASCQTNIRILPQKVSIDNDEVPGRQVLPLLCDTNICSLCFIIAFCRTAM